jgi:hypothetical protein
LTREIQGAREQNIQTTRNDLLKTGKKRKKISQQGMKSAGFGLFKVDRNHSMPIPMKNANLLSFFANF